MDDGQLVAERDDFQVQRGARLDEKSERVEQRNDDGRHKGYKGRSGSEDVAHFDVVFNLQKPQTARRQVPKKTQEEADIKMIVRAVATVCALPLCYPTESSERPYPSNCL